MGRLYLAAGAEGIDIDQIQAAREKTENDGGSFDPLSFVVEKLDDDAFDRFYNNFVEMTEHPILTPEAFRFLLRLQIANIPHSIMTYGVNPAWQKLKIEAGGMRFRTATQIMSTTDKGIEIARHRGEDGFYTYGQMLGGHDIYNARSVALVDDKAKSFGNLPEGCSGFLLRTSDQLLTSQRGEVPEGVIVIRSLDELHVHEGRLQAVPDALPESLEQVSNNVRHILSRQGAFNAYLPYLPAVA